MTGDCTHNNNNNNKKKKKKKNRLFVASHLVRAQSAYKDIKIHSFRHTHTHARTHAHTYTHTHARTRTRYKYMHCWRWAGTMKRKWQISIQKRKDGKCLQPNQDVDVQTPRTGLRHPSSNHCHNWLRHRSRKTDCQPTDSFSLVLEWQ